MQTTTSAVQKASMSISERSRPRFLMVRQEHGLTSQQVAQEADLPLSDEYRTEIGCVVEEDVAERIRAAFSRLTGKTWTLAELAITIRRKENVPL